MRDPVACAYPTLFASWFHRSLYTLVSYRTNRKPGSHIYSRAESRFVTVRAVALHIRMTLDSTTIDWIPSWRFKFFATNDKAFRKLPCRRIANRQANPSRSPDLSPRYRVRPNHTNHFPIRWRKGIFASRHAKL